jgi:hypothetical protein
VSVEKVVADVIEINNGTADKGLADISSSLLEKALPVLVHVDPEAAEVVRDELDFRQQ